MTTNQSKQITFPEITMVAWRCGWAAPGAALEAAHEFVTAIPEDYRYPDPVHEHWARSLRIEAQQFIAAVAAEEQST